MGYNGHKNWNHWNVSLWLFNDEGLYNMMRHCVKRSPTLDAATERIQEMLGEQSTPDGAPYTFASIRAALTGSEWDWS